MALVLEALDLVDELVGVVVRGMTEARGNGSLESLAYIFFFLELEDSSSLRLFRFRGISLSSIFFSFSFSFVFSIVSSLCSYYISCFHLFGCALSFVECKDAAEVSCISHSFFNACYLWRLFTLYVCFQIELLN